MAKKKKEAQPPCPHCGKVFDIRVRWCAGCGDHSGDYAWIKSGDMCDRCLSGENDEYLAKKKGRAERVEAAVAALEDKSSWCQCGMCQERRQHGQQGRGQAGGAQEENLALPPGA